MHSQNDASDEIDDNIIKKYLNFVSGIQSEFEKEALAMLKFYFIVTRSIRPSNYLDENMLFAFNCNTLS